MADWRSSLRAAADGLSRRSTLEGAGRAGRWLLRWVLGLALVLFAVSFLGPPPVEPAAVEYDRPGAVAHDAVSNLRAENYRLSLEAARVDDATGPTAFLREKRIVDNRGRRYVLRRSTDEALGTESGVPERVYGTVTTGFRQPERGPGSAGDAGWHREAHRRYHPTVNAFEDVGRLQTAPATLVRNTSDTYAVRIDNNDTVASVVSLPGHEPFDAAAWNATLRLSVARETDRVTRAEYRYRLPDSGTVVRATYRFDYGVLVDVDRPLGTYPPGDELVGRLDLGVQAGYGLAAGGRP